jgi:phosphatidylinositol alpha-1,6-mannosyltransferase
VSRTILLVTHEYAPYVGGIATYACELARAASEQGYHVEVFCPAYGEPPSQRQENPTLTVTRFPGGVFRPKRDLLPFAWRLRAKLREEYDIVHGVDWAAQMALQLLDRIVRLPAPFFLTVHGSEVLIYQRFQPHRWLMRDVFRRAAHTIAGSRFTADLVRRFDPSLDPRRLSVVYYGLAPSWLEARSLEGDVDIRERLAIPRDSFVVLTVARLVPRKGHLFVVRGLATLESRVRERITYVVVGTGDESYARALASEASRCGVRLVMAGRADDGELPAYYRAADLFALLADPNAPDVEGFGLVVIEAASQGLPSIGANIGGIPEAVLHEETGLVVDPRDSNAVGKAVEQLYRDRDQLRRFGAAARRRAAAFSWEQTARLTYTAFDDALSDREHSLPAKECG